MEAAYFLIPFVFLILASLLLKVLDYIVIPLAFMSALGSGFFFVFFVWLSISFSGIDPAVLLLVLVLALNTVLSVLLGGCLIRRRS